MNASANAITNRMTDHSYKFRFVEMSNEDEANKEINRSCFLLILCRFATAKLLRMSYAEGGT
ncbi:MAG: hypothetical protein KBC43_07675 [Bacteroidales bacterium]|nr:hypothetical protein [Bacteroidales bacterium]